MTGKVAIITGASQSIGAGLVAGYLGRGWAVVTTALTIRPADDPGVLTVAGDIAEPATAGRVLGAALDRFGRVDTLVNGPGAVIAKPFTEYTAADYATTVEVTLAGFFGLTRCVIGEMARRYGGHVVNILAVPARAGDSALAALANGGLVAATRSLAVEYGPYGIRVNAVSPGVVETPEHPLGRLGQIGDVVDGVLFLESSPAVTGEILHIGGEIAGSGSPGQTD